MWVVGTLGSIATQKVKPCMEGCGAGVEMNALLMLKHTGFSVDINVDTNNGCRRCCTALGKHTAAFDADFIGDVKVDGNAVPGGCGLCLGAMSLDGLDADTDVLWEQSEGLASGGCALGDASGDDGSDALACECAIDGKPCGEEWVGIGEGCDCGNDGIPEAVEPCTGHSTNWEHFSASKWRSGETCLNVLFDEW